MNTSTVIGTGTLALANPIVLTLAQRVDDVAGVLGGEVFVVVVAEALNTRRVVCRRQQQQQQQQQQGSWISLSVSCHTQLTSLVTISGSQ
jgi:hypothetical protein